MTILQWLIAPAVLTSAALTVAFALTGHPFAAAWCGVGTYLGARVVRFLA